jgi:predicted nucleic acid-binding Zn ribbon protein
LREPESLGSIISRGRVPGPTRKKQKLDLLAMNWGHIAGERMAAHSTPTRLIRGTLTVSADSPAWAAELSITTETLLRKIAGIMGEESVRRGGLRRWFRGGPRGPASGRKTG